MTRGDQRERDRAKAAKKKQQEVKGKTSVPFHLRKESDAEIMRQKQIKAQQKKEEEAKQAAAQARK